LASTSAAAVTGSRLVDDPRHELGAGGRGEPQAPVGETTGDVGTQRLRRLLERDGVSTAEVGEVRGETDRRRVVDPIRLAARRGADRQHDGRLAQPRIAAPHGEGVGTGDR
jgi:hypothetical protein